MIQEVKDVIIENYMLFAYVDVRGIAHSKDGTTYFNVHDFQRVRFSFFGFISLKKQIIRIKKINYSILLAQEHSLRINNFYLIF